MKAKLLLFFLLTVIVWSCDEKRLAPDEIKPIVGKNGCISAIIHSFY